MILEVAELYRIGRAALSEEKAIPRSEIVDNAVTVFALTMSADHKSSSGTHRKKQTQAMLMEAEA